jgi:hypothetical protein
MDDYIHAAFPSKHEAPAALSAFRYLTVVPLSNRISSLKTAYLLPFSFVAVMGTLGRVILLGGDFVLRDQEGVQDQSKPNKEVQDHEQQPQFLPRVDWPTEFNATRSQSQPCVDTNSDWAEAGEVRRMHQMINDIYPNLSPMIPYTGNPPCYDGYPWMTHLIVTHNFFHRALQNGNEVSEVEMMAMIRMVTYGIFHSTTCFAPWTVNRASPAATPSEPGQDPAVFKEEWNATWGRKWTAGSFGDDIKCQGITWTKQRLWTRRWVIVPILYGDSQWGVTIFDRNEGQLYIFDCGDEEMKQTRVRAARHLWVDFLNEMGQPYHFSYFVPEVTRQGNSKDSGLLCVIWLMDTLRNQVGKPMTTWAADMEEVNEAICDPNDSGVDLGQGHTPVSSLVLRDWAPSGCGTPKSRLMAVRRVIRVMVANELGLRCHDAMTKRFREWTSPHGQLPSAVKLLTEAGRHFANSPGQFPIQEYFTGLGGPHFALPMRTPVPPYDAAAPRRHEMQPLLGHVTVPARAAELMQRPDVPFNWPEGFRFSADKPASDPDHDSGIIVDSLRSVLAKDTLYSRNFDVTLANPNILKLNKTLKKKIRIVMENAYVSESDDANADSMVSLILRVGINDGPSHRVVVRMPVSHEMLVEDDGATPLLRHIATPSLRQLSTSPGGLTP